MAVDISVDALAAAIRVETSAEERAEVTRLRDYAIVAISRHLGTAYDDAPAAALNEATVRLCGYLYDQPTASRGSSYANAMRFSGAARMLLPYRVHRLSTAETEGGVVGGLGLVQIGTETVDVTAAFVWTATALPAPQTAVAGVSVLAPDGTEDGIDLFRTALLTGAGVVGGDATADLTRAFALESTADNSILFASKEAGLHRVYLYEVRT